MSSRRLIVGRHRGSHLTHGQMLARYRQHAKARHAEQGVFCDGCMFRWGRVFAGGLESLRAAAGRG